MVKFGSATTRIHHLAKLSARIAAKSIVAHLQPLGGQLQPREPLGKACMQDSRLAKLHKCPHHVDAHLHCLSRGQHIGRLNRAMLGEHQRQRFGILQFLEVITVCDHLGQLLLRDAMRLAHERDALTQGNKKIPLFAADCHDCGRDR
jgi:hypothetical protein